MRNHTQSFLVHGYEVDAFGQLGVASLAGFLQEAASNNVRALGCSIEELMQKGLTWVLFRMSFEVAEPVREGDRLEIETWPSGCERLVVYRDYEVRREDGGVVIRANSQWLVLDLESRRPVRPETVIDPSLLAESRHVLPVSREKLPRPERWDEERRFGVRYQEIDMNLHASNIAYLSWLVDAVPLETWRRSRLVACDVQYIAESRLGSALVSRAAEREPGVFQHVIVRADDEKEIARARTRWLPRGVRGDSHRSHGAES